MPLILLVTAAIAFVSAVLMPVAPVSVSTPTVSWPPDPSRPVSTELQLTAQRPLAIDVGFSCAALTAARSSGDGLLLSTVESGRLSESEGLQVRLLDDDTLAVTSNGIQVYRGAVAGGACAYRLEMDGDSARLRVDGRTVSDIGAALPDVDVLETPLTVLPGGTATDLGVALRVNDEFSTSPTTLKKVILGVLVASSLACLVMLVVWDRRRRPRQVLVAGVDQPRARWWQRLSVVDLLLVVLLIGWLFIAPNTDDDGYYSAMARNSAINGYVGNYYQLLNQGYPPFSWFYQLLGYWDRISHAPVFLRIPSLVAGLITYAVARAVVEASGLPRPRTWFQQTVRYGVVALVFATAWLPYSLGVRPESIAAVLATLAFGAVVVARRRMSLAWYAGALPIAGSAITCHPTGLVGLAPWILSIPHIWRLVRSASWWRTLALAAGVLAPAALSAAFGFIDGSLRDFIYSQDIYAALWPQTKWYDEQLRYSYLLTPNPMGSYPKRITVLVAIVTLVWFAVVQLSAAGRRRRAFPPLIALSGWSLALSLLLLWITPSKWTHHFGAISGYTTISVSCALLYGARAVVALQRGRRSLAPASILAGLSLVLVFALAMHGPNDWAYSWLLGMPHALASPFVGPVHLDSPVVWSAVVVVIGAAVAFWLPSRRRSWGRVTALAYPTAVVAFMAVGLVYLVGSFSLAAERTWDTYSPGADALQDPLSQHCGAQHAIVAADPSTTTVLPSTSATGSASTGFTSQGGYLPSSPPTRTADPQPTVWGSFPNLGGEANTGSLTTGWYSLPQAAPGLRLLVEASGRTGNGNSLVAEYGTLSDGRIAPLGSQILDDGGDNPDWRQLTLVPSPGAETVRLVATDGSNGPGGWLAVTAPERAEMKPLTQVVPRAAHVAVAWQIDFLFPCADQPATVHGITEPSQFVFAYGRGSLGGLGDAAFVRERAGLFYPIIRSSSLTQLATEMPGQPSMQDFQAFQVHNPYADAAYELHRGRTVRWGWEMPDTVG